MQFIFDHGLEVLAILGTLLVLAHQVTKLTPSTKDDEIVAKVEEVIGKYLPKQSAAKA